MEKLLWQKTSSRDLRQHKKSGSALDLGLPRSLVNMFQLFGDVYFTVVPDINNRLGLYHRDHISLRLVETDSLKSQPEAGFCAFTSDNSRTRILPSPREPISISK